MCFSESAGTVLVLNDLNVTDGQTEILHYVKCIMFLLQSVIMN